MPDFFKVMKSLLGNLYFIVESILESAHWNNKKGKPDIYVLKSETRESYCLYNIKYAWESQK